MNKTHIFSPIVLRSLAAGVILLFLLGFAAWLSLPQTRIDFSSLSLRQESRPEPVGLGSSNVNAEGLAIYRQSERDLTSPRANVEGMTIYQKSEWGTTPFARTNEAGLDIYWQSKRSGAAPGSIEEGMAIYLQSERSGAAPGSIEEGMAIYLQSERSLTATDPGSTIDQGMDIYYASERDR